MDIIRFQAGDFQDTRTGPAGACERAPDAATEEQAGHRPVLCTVFAGCDPTRTILLLIHILLDI